MSFSNNGIGRNAVDFREDKKVIKNREWWRGDARL